jgi:hypothetical protein
MHHIRENIHNKCIILQTLGLDLGNNQEIPVWLPPFPSIEGPLFLTQIFGLLDVSIKLTTSKCTAWIVVGSICLVPIVAFAGLCVYRCVYARGSVCLMFLRVPMSVVMCKCMHTYAYFVVNRIFLLPIVWFYPYVVHVCEFCCWSLSLSLSRSLYLSLSRARALSLSLSLSVVTESIWEALKIEKPTECTRLSGMETCNGQSVNSRPPKC